MNPALRISPQFCCRPTAPIPGCCSHWRSTPWPSPPCLPSSITRDGWRKASRRNSYSWRGCSISGLPGCCIIVPNRLLRRPAMAVPPSAALLACPPPPGPAPSGSVPAYSFPNFPRRPISNRSSSSPAQRLRPANCSRCRPSPLGLHRKSQVRRHWFCPRRSPRGCRRQCWMLRRVQACRIRNPAWRT